MGVRVTAIRWALLAVAAAAALAVYVLAFLHPHP